MEKSIQTHDVFFYRRGYYSYTDNIFILFI